MLLNKIILKYVFVLTLMSLLFSSTRDRPENFNYNQSTAQAFYFFQVSSIDQIPLDENDWVAAFNGDICVGSKQWNIQECLQGICDVPVMGDDGYPDTEGYMNNGDIPTFKIYDFSEDTIYSATPSDNIPWHNNDLIYIDSLNVFSDCAGVLNGDSVEDQCGICDNLPNNDCVQDCAGEWGGNAV